MSLIFIIILFWSGAPILHVLWPSPFIALLTYSSEGYQILMGMPLLALVAFHKRIDEPGQDLLYDSNLNKKW